jgi:hypothetical protein
VKLDPAAVIVVHCITFAKRAANLEKSLLVAC